MQTPDAYVLKSELALRKNAVLMHEAPPAKRQRTTNDDRIDTCARQFAYVPNSPLSPSRTQTQVTAGEPAGLIEIVGDLEDVADTLDASSPEANVPVIETQDGAVPEQPAASVAAVKAEAAPDPVDCLANSPLQSNKDETAAVQHLGVTVPSDLNLESSRSLKHEPASAQLSEHRSTDQQGVPSTSQAEQDSSDASDQHSVANQATTGHYNGCMPSTTSHATIANDSVHQSSVRQADALQLQPAPPELQEAQLASREAGAQADQPAQPVTEANGPITVEQLTAQGQYVVDTAEQQQVGINLKTYTDQVDDLQRQGRVSFLMVLQLPICTYVQYTSSNSTHVLYTLCKLLLSNRFSRLDMHTELCVGLQCRASPT